MARLSAKVNKEEVAAKVEHLAALGMTQEDAGYILGMVRETIQRNYADAWKRGKAAAKAKVASKLYEKCMNGDTASIFFYLKTQAGWREVQRIDHSSEDGSMAPKPPITLDLSGLTPEQVAKMARAAITGKTSEDEESKQ